MFQPMSFCDWPEPMPQRRRRALAPAVQAGRLYFRSCQLPSVTVLEVDQTLVHAVPFVETWINALSWFFNLSQRRNRSDSPEAPEQLMGGVVA